MMLVRVFSILTATAGIVAAAVLGYMASDREPPITVISATVSAFNVMPGGEIEWRIKFVQKKRCHIQTDRALYDALDVRYPLPTLEYQSGVDNLGEEQDIVLRFLVPNSMALGPARYEATTVYRCNILQNIWPIYSPYNPVSFEVTPP